MQQQTSAGCFIIRNIGNKCELVVLHRIWEDGREAYVIPKGHVENSENLEQTACREVREETGYINIKILSYLGSRTYIPEKMDNIEKTDHYFLAVLVNDEKVDGEEKFKVLWLELDEAFRLLTWENDPKILAKIKTLNSAHIL